jgi:DNA-binding response OmpR family regulator
MKVLLVDDDADLLDLTIYALRREGYQVVSASDGPQALSRFESEPSDIVLLDVNLPKLSGFEVCRRIRQQAEVPIIMLTARDEEEDVLRGLRLGADDYVVKPFSPKQLMARMAALLRRARTDRYRQPASELLVGDIAIDLHSHEVKKDGRVVQLTPLEFRILYLLALNEGRVIPHVRLVEYAWGYDGGDSNLLKTHICHIRKKLGLPAGEPGGIRAIPSVGYSLALSSPARSSPAGGEANG